MCGCNKNAGPRVSAQYARPSVGPRAIVGGQAAAPSPTQLRAMGLQANTAPVNANKMDANRLLIEKMRRDAIKRALNK